MQEEARLGIAGEVDRVYLSPPPELRLLEQDRPLLTVAREGFADTVVWNPGPDKARALADLPDQDWLHMLCIEAGAIAVPVTLEPGQRWEGSQTLQAHP